MRFWQKHMGVDTARHKHAHELEETPVDTWPSNVAPGLSRSERSLFSSMFMLMSKHSTILTTILDE